MDKFDPPSEPRAPGRLSRTFGLLTGLGVGVLLMAIIALTTQSPWLALLFGFVPGLAIGLALHLTARR
ncbi:hypothetical protein [Maricaulis sp. CAU 1757]